MWPYLEKTQLARKEIMCGNTCSSMSDSNEKEAHVTQSKSAKLASKLDSSLYKRYRKSKDSHLKLSYLDDSHTADAISL